MPLLHNLKNPFLPDNCRTYNKNNNLKNNILMSENIREKRLIILEYLDAYICHHYQPTSKYSRIVSLFCLIFSDIKMLFCKLLFTTLKPLDSTLPWT